MSTYFRAACMDFACDAHYFQLRAMPLWVRAAVPNLIWTFVLTVSCQTANLLRINPDCTCRGSSWFINQPCGIAVTNACGTAARLLRVLVETYWADLDEADRLNHRPGVYRDCVACVPILLPDAEVHYFCSRWALTYKTLEL
jgi:hypothetical protein